MSGRPETIPYDVTVSPNFMRPGKYLCYLNGLLVPVQSVTVNYGVGVIPTASISMFPSEHLTRIGSGDRLEVQVFYLDTVSRHSPEFNNDTTAEDDIPPAYRLLFDGTITGWNYSSTPHGRSISLAAAADISLFHQARVEFLATSEGISQYLANTGSAPNSMPRYTRFPSLQILRNGLSEGGELVKRPYEFLWNSILSLCGNTLTAEQYSVPVVNFFSRWIRKRNFVNRVVATPVFDDATTTKPAGTFPLLRAVQDTEMLALMYEAISNNLGQAASLMDLLTRTLGAVYCELNMLPTPPATLCDYNTGEIKQVLRGDAIPDTFDPGSQRLRLANYNVKPQCIFGVPPTSNIIYPGMIEDLSYEEHYNTQPTRVYAYDQYSGVVSNAAVAAYTRDLLTSAYPQEVAAAMRDRVGRVDGVGSSAKPGERVSTGKNVLVWPEEFFKGPVPSHVETPFALGILRTLLERQTDKTQADTAASGPPSNANNIETYSQLYAQYEYNRQRYEQRAGAASLKFNPYLLPGYSCVLVDNEAGNTDLVGYLTNVSHTLSKGQMATQITFGYGRTLQELYDDVTTTIATNKPGVLFDWAPLETIDEVRQCFQDEDQACKYYQKLYGIQGVGFTGVAAPSRTDVSYTLDFGAPTYRESAYPQTAVSLQGSDVASAPPTRATITNPPDDGKVYTPKNNRENYDAALERAYRPICTLQQYLAFLYGTVRDIPAEVLATERDDGVATYYGRIFRRPVAEKLGAAELTQVQGAAPAGAEGSNDLTQPAGEVAETFTATSVPYNATWKDWNEALEKYRAQVQSEYLVG